MKKILSKLTIIILLIFGLVLVSGCDEEEKPPIDNGNGQEEIKLPTEIATASSDETVYVIYDKDNKISSMKSSHHFTKAKFFKYEVKGNFLNDGHSNTTNGIAKITIENGKAYVPSLGDYDNYFYTLNLNQNHYKDKLPFNLTASYKLDNKVTTFDKLNNATGELIITYSFAPNQDANAYYKQNYAAQIQIPIDITTATIVEAKDAMAKVLVGTTNTLAYMIMPGQTKDITLKLNVKNFKYTGLQAVYQPLDQISSINELVDFDELGVNELANLPDQLDLIIEGIEGMDTNVNALFVGMDDQLTALKNELSNDMLSQFLTALQSLNFEILTLDSSYNAELLAKKGEVLATVAPVGTAITQIGTKATELGALVAAFNAKYQEYVGVTQSYELAYLNFLTASEKIETIKEKVTALSSIDFTDINKIIQSKDTMITNLTAISQSVEELKVILTNTINTMYFYPDQFEPIVDDITGLIEKNLELFSLFPGLKVAFTNLVNKIGEGFVGNWFSLTAMQDIQLLYGTLTHQDQTFQQPGIIQSLDLIIQNSANLEERMAPIQGLKNLYQINPQLQMRQIDAIYLGFVKFNTGLLVKEEGQVSSFYDGMNQLTSLTNILSLIPVPLEMELPSFLSDENLSPKSLQFIITQK